MKERTIYVGSDHAGFELKEHIKRFLRKKKFVVEDFGALSFNKDDDYPDFAKRVAEGVSKDKVKGILVCGTGVGACIVANKFKGVRAALVFDEESAKLSRQHNDANVLCLGAWKTSPKKAEKIVTAWLKTKFLKKPRFVRRLKKIRVLGK
ncbi:ribose 5-phosphate isomerase B [Candidatus Woesearchaeota archaeon]|nr:MAG: ribose 5-phosphate isomerase B [Candidatus Woesearchaeota archaeon ex4484_78]RLE46860.1 MAG: ribose 5-phosphate isomerase B [Candidatus Woesearchaeota archaeon]